MDNKIFKAYENLEFLNSHDARPIRVLCELVESSVRLEKENISNTLVFFGSARSKPSHEASNDLEKLIAALPALEQRTEEQKNSSKKPRVLLLCRRIMMLQLHYPRSFLLGPWKISHPIISFISAPVAAQA